MPLKTIVDERGRITIPAEIRRKLKLRKGIELLVEVKNGAIILKPLRRISARDLLGIAGQEEVSIEEIEQSLAYTS
ncbi:MAG TPA: AbrB/MazE/SpoVT family DNA-binding domain-containing protein [Desulfurococcaceae archaeon]|nr:AbrB/MazE/SpoVT family DNA-binding domain-containing protein [Desulfurococcaceae archaeon]